jgi:hypothetical protein
MVLRRCIWNLIDFSMWADVAGADVISVACEQDLESAPLHKSPLCTPHYARL